MTRLIKVKTAAKKISKQLDGNISEENKKLMEKYNDRVKTTWSDHFKYGRPTENRDASTNLITRADGERSAVADKRRPTLPLLY